MPRVRHEKNLAFGELNVNDGGTKKNFILASQMENQRKNRVAQCTRQK